MVADTIQEEKNEILKLLVDVLDTVKKLQFLYLSDYEISKDFRKRWNFKLKNFYSNIENYLRNEFPIVVLGRWNSGKSTLINAILGEELLPSGNKEVTSILTKVYFGNSKDVLVQFTGGDYQTIDKLEMEDYINFRGNKYSKNLKQIDVRSNSSFLESGLCILDTPGLNSINELNNNITFEIIPKAHSIILTFGSSDVGGEDNLNLIEQVFRLNFNNLYNVVFVITKSDVLDEKETKEAHESLKELINIAQKRVGVVKESTIHICMISAYTELKYQQYLKGELSEQQLINDHKLGVANVDQIKLMRNKSNFEEFFKILDESILNSQNKKNITNRLYIIIQSVLTELLKDYRATEANIKKSNESSLEQLSLSLQKKVDTESRINETRKEKIKEFKDSINDLKSKEYISQRISEIINSIYMEVCMYIEETPYEIISKNEFRELNQKIDIISAKLQISWIKKIEEEFNSKWNRVIIDISMITDKDIIGIDDELRQNSIEGIELEINGLQIKTNSLWTNCLLAFAASASTMAAGFSVGNTLFPGVGGIVGGITTGVAAFAASAIKLSTSGKRKEDLKGQLNKKLLEREDDYEKILENMRLQYELRVKQLEILLNNSLDKVIHDKEIFTRNCNITKDKYKEIEKKIAEDIKAIKELIPEISVAFSDYL